MELFTIYLILQLCAKPFTDKQLFVAVQKQVEERLNANATLVHPYCLSLDTIGNALNSLIANKCVVKQTVTGLKPTIQYIAEFNELQQIHHQLQLYASVLREFNGLSNYKANAKL